MSLKKLNIKTEICTPNGKWVWRQSANGGKGDWRVAKPGGSKATAGSAATANNKTNAMAKTSPSKLSDKEKFANMDIKEAKKKLVGKNLTFKNYWSDGKGGSVDATGKITNVQLYGRNKQPLVSVEFENGDRATVSLKQIDEGKAVGYDLSLSDSSSASKQTGDSKSEKSSSDKKKDAEIPNAAQVGISNIIKRTFGKNLSSLKFKGKKVIIQVDGKTHGSGYSSYVKSYYKDGKMTSRELENSYDKSSMDTVEKKLGTLIKYVNQIELIENYD
jgi:hypothetical protein